MSDTNNDTLEPFRDSSDLILEACSWVAQWETGDLLSEDIEVFEEWVSRSPRHRREFLRALRISLATNVLAITASPSRTRIGWLQGLRDHTNRVAQSIRWRYAAALVLFMGPVLGGLLAFTHWSNARENYVLHTDVGSIQSFELSDGTNVQLNGNSDLKVEYRLSERHVQLLKGEAFFNVAHNKGRPFLVSVGNSRFRAVGTAFSVARDGSRLRLVVAEGQVEFRKENSGAVQVRAGQRLLASQSRTVYLTHATDSQIDSDLSWRNGYVEFTGMPLSDVAQEWFRYSDIRIVLDQSARNLKFDGSFRTNEIDKFLDTLDSAYGLKVRWVDERTVLIEAQSRLDVAR